MRRPLPAFALMLSALSFACGRLGYDARALRDGDASGIGGGAPSDAAASDDARTLLRVRPTLLLATTAKDLSLANGETKVGVVYSDGTDRKLVELGVSGDPVSGPARVADAVYDNELVIAPAGVGYFGAYSNHRILGQWQVYVSGVGDDAPAAMDARVSNGTGEAMAPAIARVNGNWAVSWRDGGKLGFALVDADGAVARRTVVESLGVFPIPDRILVSSRGFDVLMHGDRERAVEHFAPNGTHTRRGGSFTAAAVDAAFLADDALGVLAATDDRLSLRRYRADSDVAVGSPTMLQTAAAPITAVRIAVGPTGTGLLWIAATPSPSLWFSTLESGDVPSTPIQLSDPNASVSEAQLAATDAAFVVVWIETAPNAALRAASITR